MMAPPPQVGPLVGLGETSNLEKIQANLLGYRKVQEELEQASSSWANSWNSGLVGAGCVWWALLVF